MSVAQTHKDRQSYMQTDAQLHKHNWRDEKTHKNTKSHKQARIDRHRDMQTVAKSQRHGGREKYTQIQGARHINTQ